MAQVKLNIHFDQKTMGCFNHIMYLEISNDLMIDGEDINDTYPFDNDIQKLSLVKTPYYPKVLIVTPRLKLRFTNWDTIGEAKGHLTKGNLWCYQIIVDNETYYVVAHTPDEISEFYHPVAKLSRQPFDTPFIDKEETHPEFRPQKAFVTNATAKSAIWIAYIYDQHLKGSTHKISEVDLKEYENLFSKESDVFARLYNAASSNFSIVENVIENLSRKKRKEFFYEEDVKECLSKLKRHIFHMTEDCVFMKQDFLKINGKRLDNSGVYEVEDENHQYYLHVDYLFRLGFKGCLNCNIGYDKMEPNWGDAEKQLIVTLYKKMLCPTSLIAQVFRCDENVIIEHLKEYQIYEGYSQNAVQKHYGYDPSQEIEIDLDDDE